MTSTLRRVHGWVVQLTGASALLAAAGFHATIAWVGPELATGLLFYAAETEAVPTAVPHPWSAVVPVWGLGLVLVGSSIARRSPGLGWLGLAAGLASLGQGVSQILQLMEAARP